MASERLNKRIPVSPELHSELLKLRIATRTTSIEDAIWIVLRAAGREKYQDAIQFGEALSTQSKTANVR